MRLLILGMNYAPEVTGIAPFTTGLAEHLGARGHQITVATTFPHYPQWRIQPPYERRWRVTEQRQGVEVLRSRVLLPKRRRTASRVAYDSSLAAGALLNTLATRRPDALLCVTPPIQVGLLAAAYARRWRIPLTLLVKDLPLDAAVAVGMLSEGLAYRMGRWLERQVYGAADHIIVISAGFRDSLARGGVPADKVSVIPDWADTEYVYPLDPDLALRRQLGAEAGDFLLLHTGNLGEKQGLESAVLAVERAGTASRLRLAFVGDGSDRQRLEQVAATRHLSNVCFLPLQPTEIFPRLLSSADALLLHQRANVIDSVAPSKLLTYMAAGRPVIAAVHPKSEAAAVVRAADCGITVPPERPDSLVAAAAELADAPKRAAQLGANGRRHVEAHYARAEVLHRYETCLYTLSAAYGARARRG